MFPRLNLETGEVIPPDTRFRIGDEFARVDPPNTTSLNEQFRVWRMVKWQVVARQHQRWNVDTHEYETIDGTAFMAVYEEPLDAADIEFWQDYAAQQEAQYEYHLPTHLGESGIG